jgi:hypothetical protein
MIATKALQEAAKTMLVNWFESKIFLLISVVSKILMIKC